MSKKHLLVTVFFIFLIGYINAQTFDLRHYSDFRSGFRGVAAAIYIDNIRYTDIEISDIELDEIMEEFFEEMFESQGRSVYRITRNNQWLARQALNEWDLEYGDIFLIVVAEHRFSETALVMIALVESNGEDFRWWARIMSDMDFE